MRVRQGRVTAKVGEGRLVRNSIRCKEHDAYRQALERLLRDLKVEASPATDG